MAYRFEIDPINNIMMVRFEREITFASLKHFYLDDARRMLELTRVRGTIVDFSPATALEVTPEQIRELASYPPVDPDPSRIRVIVATSAHVFGLSRMFELHGEETRPNLHVVASLNQAYALLGVKEPKFQPVSEPSSE